MKAPKKLTKRRLTNVTTYYLERYSTTRGHLRRLLVRRVDTSLRHFEGDRDEMVGWVDELLDKLEASKHIDDRSWAMSRAKKLVQRGLSERGIRSKLRLKSVPSAVIDEVLEVLAPDPRQAAAKFARKRHIGPFRRGEADLKKELGKMGRAGFPYGIAREVLELTLEEAEDLAFPPHPES